MLSSGLDVNSPSLVHVTGSVIAMKFAYKESQDVVNSTSFELLGIIKTLQNITDGEGFMLWFGVIPIHIPDWHILNLNCEMSCQI